MDGFKRPTRPRRQPAAPNIPPGSRTKHKMPQLPEVALPEISMAGSEKKTAPLPWYRRKKPLIAISSVVVLLVTMLGIYFWYMVQLEPVNIADESSQQVEIKEGSSLNFVASRLKERGLIRSSLAFKVLANVEGKQNAVKAGTCSLTPSDSSRAILDKIIAGCEDFKSITFYPGATLETSLYAKTKAEREGKEFNDMSIRASLREVGFSDGDITRAFAARYDSPLFAGKPADQGYEGYVFGETYFVDTSATAEEVLKMVFDHMYEIVQAEDLEVKYKEKGLSLYEGITLASIVQREVRSEADQKQVAQVFLDRIKLGMSLGADSTFEYAAKNSELPPDPSLDSPYNTRKYTGLPPGPIASPSRSALVAVADPAEGDYLYFVSGDDGVNHFSHTNEEHEANVRKYCTTLCFGQ